MTSADVREDVIALKAIPIGSLDGFESGICHIGFSVFSFDPVIKAEP